MTATGGPVLVVDNHDSFVHTLIGYLHELGARTEVVEADAVTDPVSTLSGHAAVLVSPGPGTPARAGASIAVVGSSSTRIGGSSRSARAIAKR